MGQDLNHPYVKADVLNHFFSIETMLEDECKGHGSTTFLGKEF
ncbi:hypothetical protein B4102_2447 [Heyndrickxia sporothermodurans]|uniref:Uncharacterized protein n=1 Tax=Heyndrickxia sporothermodurans TaxID=46224 RepID=A0A150LC65_9BACI|nr:hypothetical protein B4102_2447 [Heyndrickxia sporothermodurans]